MNEDTKSEINICLDMLKKTLIRNGVSAGFDKAKNSILFFDTNIYLDTGKIQGVTVSLESLVK